MKCLMRETFPECNEPNAIKMENDRNGVEMVGMLNPPLTINNKFIPKFHQKHLRIFTSKISHHMKTRMRMRIRTKEKKKE